MPNSQVALILDPQIRDWVLFPITFVMILVGILRNYIISLLQNNPKKVPNGSMREQRALLRSQILRESSANSPIAPLFYQSIFTQLSQAFAVGTFLKESTPSDGTFTRPPNALSDPSAMDGMMAGMKTQAVMMVPQMILMGWINFFFQGFVLIKLPFPLTLGFRSMLQRGIETSDMDVEWVSSLSWYFLNYFGLNGLYQLLLNFNDSAATRDIVMSMYAGATVQQPAQVQDFSKLFKSEIDNLAFTEGTYLWISKKIEQKVLQKYGRTTS